MGSLAAHVYAADQGLQLQNETVESIMYDDAAMLLLVIKGGVVFAYDVAADVPAQHEQLVWTYPLQEGPSVLRARCSLDRQLLSLQRSPLLLELVDLLSGNISVMASDKGRHELLGMFFSELPDAQLVLVSRAGLEMCTFAARRQGLHSKERLRLPVHWYQYSHETRCCLVATGPPLGPPYMQAWQFLATGMVTLPSFTLASSATGTALNATPTAPRPIPAAANAAAPLTQTSAVNSTTSGGPSNDSVPSLPISTHASAGVEEAPNRGLNGGGRATAGARQVASGDLQSGDLQSNVEEANKPNEAGAWRAVTQPVSSLLSWMGGGGSAADALGGAGMVQNVLPSWPSISTAVSTQEVVPPASSVRLIKMYGRVYCAHISPGSRRLDLYRLFTDTVALQHSYALPAVSTLPPSPFLAGASISGSPGIQPASSLGLSVVDNVLVLHVPNTGSTLLFDICADASSPLSGPCPLGHLAPLRRPRQLHEERLQLQLARQLRAAVATGKSAASGSGAGSGNAPDPQLPQPTAWSVIDGGAAGGGMVLHPGHTQFHLPNLIIDSRSQVVYRLLLDLPAIVHDSSSHSHLASFLQRRRAPRLHAQPVELILGLGLPSFVLPPSPLPSSLIPGSLPSPAQSATPRSIHTVSSTPGSISTSPVLSSSLPDRIEAMVGRRRGEARPARDVEATVPQQLTGAGRSADVAGLPVRGASRSVSTGMAEGSASHVQGDVTVRSGCVEQSGGSQSSHPVMLSGVLAVGAITCKLLLLQHVNQLLQEEVALSDVRGVLDAINKAYSEVALAAAAGRAAAAVGACVVTPSDLLQHILQPMCAQGAQLTPTRHKYMQGVLAEMVASVVAAGIRPPAGLQLLSLQMTTTSCMHASVPGSTNPEAAAAASQLQTDVTFAPSVPKTVSGSGSQAAAAPAWLQAAAEGLRRDMDAVTEPALVEGPGTQAAGTEASTGRRGNDQVVQDVLARTLHCSLPMLSPDIDPQQVQVLRDGMAIAQGVISAHGNAVGRPATTMSSSCMAGAVAAWEAGMALQVMRAQAASSSGRPISAAIQPGTAPTAATVSPAQGWRSGAAPGDGSSISSSNDPGVAVVTNLIAAGKVVKAARMARELHVSQLPPSQLLQAAVQSGGGGSRVDGVVAAVYRCFRPALLPLYGSLEEAQQAVDAAVQAVA